MKNQIIYYLTIEDIQTVSEQEVGRKLSNQEIEMIIDVIAEKIKWYEAIANSISEKIEVVV